MGSALAFAVALASSAHAGSCPSPTILVTDTSWQVTTFGQSTWVNAVVQPTPGGSCPGGDTFYDATFCGATPCAGATASSGCVELRFNGFAHSLCGVAVAPSVTPTVEPIWHPANQWIGCNASTTFGAVALGFQFCCQVYDFRKTVTIPACGVSCAEIEISADDAFAIRVDNSSGPNQLVVGATVGAPSSACVFTYNLAPYLLPGSNTIHLLAQDTTVTTGACGGFTPCGNTNIGSRWLAARIVYCEVTPCVSATRTSTRSVTATRTPTSTRTATRTESPTSSATWSWTVSVTTTNTESSTRSPTLTPSPTATPTPDPCSSTAPFPYLDASRNLLLEGESAAICWGVSEGGPGSVRVFNSAGESVRSLHPGPLAAAYRYGAVWNGLTDSGERVASGVYVVRLESSKFRATRRLAVVR